MLDKVPYVVVKEYFFKNTASTMIDFVQDIKTMAEEASTEISNIDKDEESKTLDGAKAVGNKLMDIIKKKFHDIDKLSKMAIDIPYTLYAGLRAK